MERLFEPPISTSNLHAPNIEAVWEIFSGAFNESGELQSERLTSLLEQKLCEYHNSKYCITFSTGFWALVAAVKLKAIPERSEVIIPSMTYRRLADVVFWSDNVPVLVDVEPVNLAICPNAVESMITKETALILGVHPIVNCCDVEQLLALADHHNLPIVFDAVESVHETFAGKRIGSFGVGEVFSFHASKLMNGLEGGYVCTNEETFRDSLINFRGHGEVENANGVTGINGVMNEAHAAFAIAELAELEQNVIHNESIYRAYKECLKTVDGIDLLEFDESEQTSFKNVVAKVGSRFPLSRDQLVATLNEQGILARAHYSPALHTKEYRYPVKLGDMHVSHQAMNMYVNLPCGSRVLPRDIKTLCRHLQSLASN